MTEARIQPHGAVVVGVEGSASDEQPLQAAIAQARQPPPTAAHPSRHLRRDRPLDP